MRLKDILNNIEITQSHADDSIEITGVAYDSRRVRAGDVFVAVRGFQSDGHDYIGAAVERGASCVLCEKAPEQGVAHVICQNTRRALATASANFMGNPAEKLKIIGVTGTNGKTTVTSLIKEIIEYCTGEPVGLIGTNRNMIGEREIETEHTTPEATELHALFAEMLNSGCKYAVMEVSSHALTLDRVYGIEFEAGIFTNLTQDHLDFHGTMEAYAQSKGLLFSHCRHAIANFDDEWLSAVTESARGSVFTFSADSTAADLVSKRVRLLPESIEFCALSISSIDKVTMGIPGQFSVYNALAALSCAIALGFSVKQAAEALARTRGVMGRAEVVPLDRDYTVVIDYAHTPDGLEKIIKALRNGAKGRLITLFGCGGDRDRTKRPLMGKIAAELSDFVVVTSDNPRTESPEAIIDDILAGLEGTQTPYSVIVNRREAIRSVLTHAEPGDTVLLAGKGHETYQIIGTQKTHFDEREEVRLCLSEQALSRSAAV